MSELAEKKRCREGLRCVYGPLSSGEFAFDAVRNATVLLKVVERRKDGLESAGVELLFVEPLFGKVTQALKNLAKEKGKANLVKCCSGRLADHRAVAVGFGCIQRLAKCGENNGNVEFHRAFDSQLKGSFAKLVADQLGEGAMAESGKAYVFRVPGNHALALELGLRQVVNVLGPNMNPAKENALSDYSQGELELESAYNLLFDAFIDIAVSLQADSRLEKTASKKRQISAPITPIKLQSLNPIGMGTLPLGVTYPDEKQRPARQEAIKMIHQALDLGVEFFDTADTYGRDGNDLHYCEVLLRESFETYQGSRDLTKVAIATKAGMIRIGSSSSSWRMSNMKPNSIRKSIERSWEALGGNRPIYLWQLHHSPNSIEDFKAVLYEVSRCKLEGLISHVGLCNCTLEELRIALAILPIVSVQSEYSIWNLKAEEPEGSSAAKRSPCGLLPYCQEHSIMFIPHGFLGGLKSRDSRRNLSTEYPKLVSFANEIGFSPQAILLAWSRKRWSCMLHIPGSRTLSHLVDSQSSLSCRLDSKQLQTLNDILLTPGKRKSYTT